MAENLPRVAGRNRAGGGVALAVVPRALRGSPRGPVAFSHFGRAEPLTRPAGRLVYGCWCDALAAETTETKDESNNETQVLKSDKASRKSSRNVFFDKLVVKEPYQG